MDKKHEKSQKPASHVKISENHGKLSTRIWGNYGSRFASFRQCYLFFVMVVHYEKCTVLLKILVLRHPLSKAIYYYRIGKRVL